MSASSNTSPQEKLIPTDDLRALYFRDVHQHDLLNPEEEASLAKQKTAGAIASMMLEQNIEHDEVTADKLEQIKLLGEQATQGLVASNLLWVAHIAGKYAKNGNRQSYLDVCQEGNIGLINAVERFDYTKGYRLNTYASWWIRQSIQKGRSNWDASIAVHIPPDPRRLMVRITRIYEDHIDFKGYSHEQALEATANECSVDPSEVPDYLNLFAQYKNTTSLDKPMGNDDRSSSLGEIIESRTTDSPEGSSAHNQVNRELREIIDVLFPEQPDTQIEGSTAKAKQQAMILRQRAAILLRYFPTEINDEPMTLEGIAHELGVSHQRVSQLLSSAHSKIQRYYEKMGIEMMDDVL